MILLFPILFTFLLIFNLVETPTPLDRWLVEIEPQQGQCIDDWWTMQEFEGKSYLKRKLTIENWYVIEIPEIYSNALKQLSCIRKMTPDDVLEKHSTFPNDPEFGIQSDMSLIGMPEAWDIATGGLTINGDTIVVAVIDDGFQLDHEDLVGNLWHNPKEIADDGIDNDNNGYIDDYFGLNTTTGNDDHLVLRHGTSVSGIIGALGNNGIGVSGVNWNVKLMLISYDYHVSGIAEAYQYVVDMRKKYNETKGEEGAFVVAVNLSSGIAYAKPENYPIWCSMYDKLGAEGILGVCSTSNVSHNADKNGDLPALCPSPFTIIVTNVSPEDELMDNAGYGRLSVDLGAPGEKSWTTDINNTYSHFAGTSGAAPHVTGTVALLYSAACQSFFDSLESNPSSIALRIKNIILTSGTPNKTLEGITLSGKRLQTDVAIEALDQECEGIQQPKPLIRFISPNPTWSGTTNLYFEISGDPGEVLVELYTIDGIKIQSSVLQPEDYVHGFLSVDTGALPGGIYLVSLRSGKEFDTVKLFVL